MTAGTLTKALHHLEDSKSEGAPERDQIIQALREFVAGKPNIEPGNYSDRASYRMESRSVTRDRHHAETLIRAVECRAGITAEKLKDAFPRAFSGRLALVGEVADLRCSYCAGQYFPTEYRKAVCAVMARALWDYWREGQKAGREPSQSDVPGWDAKFIRKSARKEFGLEIAKRYFDYRVSDYK